VQKGVRVNCFSKSLQHGWIYGKNGRAGGLGGL
jgi:hypothetical protein